MADWNDPRRTGSGVGTTPGIDGRVEERVVFDEGLRKHMLSIYNYMSSGVLLSGIIAMLFANSGMAATLFAGGPLMWLVILSPLAIVFAMSFGRNKFSTFTLQAMFWAFAALMGLSLSRIFLLFSLESIGVTFFATSAAFAGLSLWGYTTKKDISGWGAFLIMGVVGLIVASLLNMFFFQSPGFHLAVAGIGVLIFAGLTAYDTQALKREYLAVQHAKMTNPAVAAQFPMGKLVILGALTLYLDFINMFQFLLSFLGSQE
ncbi:Bax inhibitor-1/YccA family protein [Erythrobacter sp. HKB08]|uniref:Bax inhibitor-1/YccA family protein n=1 Tax=Erythrobacter sp. HKB08 TaxID=2502843 RepID=UPI001008B901|nr:Bax inhibitor-1/YccA family protein [Erythrobacter sp. HKB08]